MKTLAMVAMICAVGMAGCVYKTYWGKPGEYTLSELNRDMEECMSKHETKNWLGESYVPINKFDNCMRAKGYVKTGAVPCFYRCPDVIAE